MPPEPLRRLAILDDYQGVALAMGPWDQLPPGLRVEVFRDTLKDQDALVARLEPFDAILAMRERTPFPASLIRRLPNLRLLVSTAARNLAPRPVYIAARAFIVAGRTLHEVIIAIFFVKLFGFGPVAGLLTLGFASAIFLGKMLAEDIENVRMGPVEAVRATGGGFGQTVIYAIVPQVLARKWRTPRP